MLPAMIPFVFASIVGICFVPIFSFASAFIIIPFCNQHRCMKYAIMHLCTFFGSCVITSAYKISSKIKISKIKYSFVFVISISRHRVVLNHRSVFSLQIHRRRIQTKQFSFASRRCDKLKRQRSMTRFSIVSFF